MCINIIIVTCNLYMFSQTLVLVYFVLFHSRTRFHQYLVCHQHSTRTMQARTTSYQDLLLQVQSVRADLVLELSDQILASQVWED